MFQFKQFTIRQDKCSMKVTTDACILGAWTPVLPGVKHVLDIGAGTGLLSLMLAQRSLSIAIDAIESEHDAAVQAGENAASSPWKERINIIEGDIRSYNFNNKFDLIISNPPFFINSLRSDDETKNKARHNDTMAFTDLLNAMNNLLNEGGYASILLPAGEYEILKQLLEENGWHESCRLSIRHRQDAPAKRIVGLFSRKKQTGLHDELLTIYDDKNNYTARFKELLAPFYLYL